MSERAEPGTRSWMWMAGFGLLFVVLGVLDLAGGDVLTGGGLLVCGAGSALFAVGDHRDGTRASGRPWRVLGGVVSLVGIGLLAMGVF